MDLLKEIKVATDVFIKMKKECCLREKGPHDLTPMLHFKYKNKNRYCGALLIGDDVKNIIPQIWMQIIAKGTPEFLILMTEAYCKKSQNLENYEYGQMKKEYENDPTSDVNEMISIHGIDIESGVQADGMVEFRYNDYGQPEFDEPFYNYCQELSLKTNIPVLFEWCRKQICTN